ncbi:hypothetical protein GCM10009639_42310 [Kitasatospora putterlickiae]|uniref:Ricin B lectin domain-containing protein n=1 Tax=Kitasatospora putterlickiae TaxID=221725 RepID=A0ABN1Y8E8_9ACTN
MTRRRTTRRLGAATAVLTAAAGLVLVPAPGAHADSPPAPIHPYVSATTCLEVADWRTDDGAPVRIWTCHGGANQQWIRTGYQEFVNVHSGKCLDVPNYSTTPGTGIVQWTCNRGLNQAWSTFRYAMKPGWYAANRHSGFQLDLYKGGLADGTPVVQFPLTYDLNQRWL